MSDCQADKRGADSVYPVRAAEEAAVDGMGALQRSLGEAAMSVEGVVASSEGLRRVLSGFYQAISRSLPI
jgi:hypothetical protein